MFFEPTSTPYDLNWRMLGTHVRVHPWFWLMTLLLGWDLARAGGLQLLFVWVMCVLVSILVHEFGHVLMGRCFGTDGHIILYGLGGLAVGSSALSNRWQRIAVSFAGPLAGFMLAAVVLLIAREGIYFNWNEAEHNPWPHFVGIPGWSRLVNGAVEFLIWINLAWGLLNLLPIWPLDGGQISRDLLSYLSPQNGVKLAYAVSMGVGAVLALHALAPQPIIPFLPYGGDWWIALLFGSFAFSSYQAFQAERTRPRWERVEDW